MPFSIDVGTGLAILGCAFGAWAWVVAWGVNTVRREVTNIATSSTETQKSLTMHIHQTERRLTMLETEFKYVVWHRPHPPMQEKVE